MRVAAAQYRALGSRSTKEFSDHVAKLVRTARLQGADLVAFPEYLCADLIPAVSAREEAMRLTPREIFIRLDTLLEPYLEAMATIAVLEGIWIVGGTFAARDDDGSFRNVAHVFGPTGEYTRQAKIRTGYELIYNEGLVQGGTVINPFLVGDVMVGVLVCYDAQFPESARAVVDGHELDLLIVPGCALEEWGVWRLRTSAAARAMESLCFSINVQLAGGVPLVGQRPYRFWARSSIHAPISRPFAPTGLLADAGDDSECVIIADCDVELLRRSRPGGLPSIKDRGLSYDVAEPRPLCKEGDPPRHGRTERLRVEDAGQ